MKNCLYEVKRDIMLRKSKSASKGLKKPARYQSAVDIRKDDGENPCNISMISGQLNLSDKYDLVSKFLGHEQVLDTL